MKLNNKKKTNKKNVNGLHFDEQKINEENHN